MALPTDPNPLELPPSPRRVLMESPLATAGWIRLRRQQRGRRASVRGQHWFALLGTVLMHVLFLAIFVLGPPYDWEPPPDAPEQYLQVRLIDADELSPPPPPPVPGTLPRQRGPRHQGRATTAAAPGTQRAGRSSPRIAASAPLHGVTPPPPVNLPVPAALPQLQPVPLADQLPGVTVAMPTLQPPVPPKFQPKPVRAVREEGRQPVLPPTSLALPEVPAAAPPPVLPPSVALRVEPSRMDAPASALRVQQPAAPVPALQPVPVPTPPVPAVKLQAQLHVPTPVVPRDLPRVQAPVLDVAEAPPQAIPVPPVAAVRVAAPPATVKVAVPETTAKQSVPVATPVAEAPPAVQVAAAPVSPPPIESTPPAAAPASVPVAQAAARAKQMATASAASTQPDASTAPNATPQGRDDAILGPPAATSAPGVAVGATSARASGAPSGPPTAAHAQGPSQLAGQTGGNQPGVAQGERSGTPGGYIQLKPHGDTAIMRHSAPNIGYQPTRFEGDWTPYGESSIDTALRRAVEKTTVEHTFHLPRGIRVKCVVMPLLPMALGGCGGADPPPVPVATKVYDRLHLAPANPVAAPTPAATTAPASAAPLKLDNAAECAAARITGGPPPPNCAGAVPSLAPPRAPAATSSSWVPASDQFH